MPETFGDFWWHQLWPARLSLLVSAVILTRALFRSGILVYRLYSSPAKISPRSILDADFDPVLLAGYALSHRVPTVLAPKERIHIAAGIDRESFAKKLYGTRTAFRYLRGNCTGLIDSISRAGRLTLLISLLAVSQVSWVARCGEGKTPLFFCLVQSLDRASTTLSLELLSCALIFCLAGFFTRKLHDRKISWTYLFERLQDELRS